MCSSLKPYCKLQSVIFLGRLSYGLKYCKLKLYSWRVPGDRCRQNLDYIHVKYRKDYKECPEAEWGGYLLWQQITGCKDVR